MRHNVTNTVSQSNPAKSKGFYMFIRRAMIQVQNTETSRMERKLPNKQTSKQKNKQTNKQTNKQNKDSHFLPSYSSYRSFSRITCYHSK